MEKNCDKMRQNATKCEEMRTSEKIAEITTKNHEELDGDLSQPLWPYRITISDKKKEYLIIFGK